MSVQIAVPTSVEMHISRPLLLFLTGMIVFSARMNCAEGRQITVEDCVQTRHVVRHEVRIAPDGRTVAYLVKIANWRTNRNKYQLYVRGLDASSRRRNGRLLLEGQGLSGLVWTADSKSLMILEQQNRRSVILRVNSEGHGSQVVVTSPRPIEGYATDAKGEIVAFSRSLIEDQRKRFDKEMTLGFPVTFGDPVFSHFSSFFVSTSQYEVLVVHRIENRTRTLARITRIESLISEEQLPLLGVRFLSVSPDGRFLTFTHLVKEIPEGWKSNPFVKYLLENHTPATALGFYDVRGKTFRKHVFPSPCFSGAARWSDDGRSFAVVAGPPIPSPWEEELEREKPVYLFTVGLWEDMNPFVVDTESGHISRLVAATDSGPSTLNQGSAPLAWKRAHGELTLTVDGNTFFRLLPDGPAWRVVAKFTSPLKQSAHDVTAASDGEKAVTLFETTMDPPDLAMFDFRSGSSSLLTDLNPEFQKIAFGHVEKVHWTNKYGAECSGYLIKPVGYVPGKTYPLVIMAKDWDSTFISDTRFHTAFPPQPLAGAGFLVLMANDPSRDQEPMTHPGQIGEAYNWVEMVRSAINLLVGAGLAEKDLIGIIGFSRTSWKLDFMLTHADLSFAAASSADGGNYNYSVYSIQNSDGRFKVDENMYGGPPYGATLANWLKYAPAFNADKVTSPLLMEYIGEGSLTWFSGIEFFTALNKQGKTVEFYYYPSGEHTLDTPLERVASLRRNLDWFRFWMQGCESAPPEYDSHQYDRWRTLRKQYALHLDPVGHQARDAKQQSCPP